KLREKEKGTGTANLDEIAEHAEGLVCLTGGEEGVLAASLSNKGFEDARKDIELLTTIFGRKNVYVELQRHCDVVEERSNQAAVRLGESLALPASRYYWLSLREGSRVPNSGSVHLYPQLHVY